MLLFKSRKFWLLILDTVISIVMYVVGNFFPEAQDHTKFFIGALQPIFVMLILAIAVEDAAEKRAGNFPGAF
jgi:hypothetical protein